uniref:Transposase, MuDR, MULE transposase domain protein n=1 Tax=Tanacetum cinerariifolium TaxID=118510 RepID=A0A6L2KYF8_TANCI|nr:transposase, MuDR, MULE transposase domain protein [Tanacetum cinerariifolium]
MLCCEFGDFCGVFALLWRLCRCVAAVVVVDGCCDDIEIQFGRKEFCLVTGLRFGVDYSSLYSEGRIPFRRRVFDSARDGHPIIAKTLEDKIKSKRFFTINDKDVVSICLLAILELVLLGQEPRHNVSECSLRDANVRRWPVFYAAPVEEDDDKHKYTLYGFTWAFKPDAYYKLCQADPQRWSRAHCPLISYNYMTSNSVESVNACTVFKRKLPVTMLAETYRAMVQDWYFKR